MQIITFIKIQDIITLLNTLSGFFAINLLFKQNFLGASILLLLATIFDYLDGKVAKMNQSKTKRKQDSFGKDLDSLADLISFVIAPALFVITLVPGYLSLFIGTLFVLSGILRLARYNTTPRKDYFEGMPTTLNGIIIPLMYCCHVYILALPLYLFPIILLLATFLMVSTLRFFKL